MNRERKKIKEDYQFNKICKREGCKNMTQKELDYMDTTMWLGSDNKSYYVNIYNLKNWLKDSNYHRTIGYYLYYNNISGGLRRLYREFIYYIK